MGKTNNSTVPAFGMKDRLGYMFGDFGNDFTFILSSMFMMKFYTDVMGLSAGVVGMLMMAARFVDAFTDVTMGQIVDRSKPTKDGKFRPWIKRMCGPVAIASFLIYQSGLADMPYGVKVAYMVVTYLLWDLFSILPLIFHMDLWRLQSRRIRQTELPYLHGVL